MALLMVHLLAAQLWTQAHAKYRDDPDFYLGVISPDAIHVRDHDDKSHKNEIHLNNWISPHPDEVVKYWKEHHDSFDIGYGIHVLTDAQWVPRYRARIPQLINPDGRVKVDLYYEETFATDYELYHQKDGRRLFDLVEKGHAPKNHPLLTGREFSEWQGMMVESYHNLKPRSKPAKYIDVDYVQAFIEDCQALMDETYEEVFQ